MTNILKHQRVDIFFTVAVQTIGWSEFQLNPHLCTELNQILRNPKGFQVCISLLFENIFFHLTQEMEIYIKLLKKLKSFLKTPVRRNIKSLILFASVLKAIHQPFICLLQWDGRLDKDFSLSKLHRDDHKRRKQENLKANTKLSCFA